MASIKKNPIMQGVSGKIGKELVMRYRMGQQEVYAKPAKPKAPPSASQVCHQNKFASHRLMPAGR